MTNEVPFPALQSADAAAPVYERYCKKIRREINIYGLEQALARWRVVCDYMQTEEWWHVVAAKVEDTIDEIIQEMKAAQQADREREKEAKPSVLVINQNESNGIKQLDQLNGVVEKDAEVTHTKHN